MLRDRYTGAVGAWNRIGYRRSDSAHRPHVSTAACGMLSPVPRFSVEELHALYTPSLDARATGAGHLHLRTRRPGPRHVVSRCGPVLRQRDGRVRCAIPRERRGQRPVRTLPRARCQSGACAAVERRTLDPLQRPVRRQEDHRACTCARHAGLAGPALLRRLGRW
ncbi:hypothetical protein XHV734_1409 [Xanthomonas hortorum pv. vitians]|nr:hypothetical protein XHV734_1409 [Xanthomonas hortorum pv. vitians]